MSERLQNLRDAVRRRGHREVQVDADGRVREVQENQRDNIVRLDPRDKGTKLARRTFGGTISCLEAAR